MQVAWNFPTRILFEAGAVALAGAEAQRLGVKSALIVSDRGVVDSGLLVDLEGSLRRSKVSFERFDALSSNPQEAEVLAAAAAFRDSGAQLVIALGGGSAIDVGKLVRILATHPEPLGQYDVALGGAAKISASLPPMIAIPTTAGTGSEVGRSAVVTLAATGRKTVVFAPQLIPEVAILDPALSRSLPPAVTAATGFDALTHCVEAYSVDTDHPMADAIALQGIRLIAHHLLTAVQEGDNLQARGGMLKAAMMGAVAFQKGLGACHALAHPLSTEHRLHHGLANALCLPAVLDFNRAAAPAKVAHMAGVLGVRSDDEETLAFECSGAVRALRSKVGLPTGLTAVGIDEKDLQRLAGLAMEDASHADNPRTCSREDMLALYRASM